MTEDLCQQIVLFLCVLTFGATDHNFYCLYQIVAAIINVIFISNGKCR